MVRQDRVGLSLWGMHYAVHVWKTSSPVREQHSWMVVACKLGQVVQALFACYDG